MRSRLTHDLGGVLIFLALFTFPVVERASARRPGSPRSSCPSEQAVRGPQGVHADLPHAPADRLAREGGAQRRPHLHGLRRHAAQHEPDQRPACECHTDKAEFCDRCHNYAGVNPYCWDCHTVPEGEPSDGLSTGEISLKLAGALRSSGAGERQAGMASCGRPGSAWMRRRALPPPARRPSAGPWSWTSRNAPPDQAAPSASTPATAPTTSPRFPTPHEVKWIWKDRSRTSSRIWRRTTSRPP